MSEPLNNIRKAIDEHAAPREEIRNINWDMAVHPELYQGGAEGKDQAGGSPAQSLEKTKQEESI
jgi:hypothetical protein